MVLLFKSFLVIIIGHYLPMSNLLVDLKIASSSVDRAFASEDQGARSDTGLCQLRL